MSRLNDLMKFFPEMEKWLSLPLPSEIIGCRNVGATAAFRTIGATAENLAEPSLGLSGPQPTEQAISP